MYCLIRFIFIILLVSLRVEAKLLQTTNRPQCCHSDQLLLTSANKCINHNLNYSSNQDSDLPFSYAEEQQSDPTFNCTKDDKLANATVATFNQTNQQKYCVQSSADTEGLDIVLYCSSKNKIRKCCPAGQIVNRYQIGQCIDFNGTSLESKIGNLTNSTSDDWIILEDQPVHCNDSDYNVYLPGEFNCDLKS